MGEPGRSVRVKAPVRIAVAAAAAIALAVASAPALASPYIQAHRGGPLKTVGGELRPAYPENSLPAFRHAAKAGFVLEMDTRITADGRAVIMHDASLKRTTTCTGLVAEKTLAEIRSDCEIDIIGTDEVSRHLGKRDERRARVPTLIQALGVADRAGVGANVEVNNYPTDPGFDPGTPPQFALRMARQIKKSGFPPGDLILQSFLPGNLTAFQDDPYFDDSETSFLTLESLNGSAAAIADANGIDWISPQWPVSRELISDAHAKGLRVVPFTFDEKAPVKAAAKAGADALIANDPIMARKAAKAVEPDPPPVPAPPSESACARYRADNTAKPVVNLHRGEGPRVFALQYKQDLVNVVSYRSFRTKIECMIRDYVVPHLAKGRPNVVALNEDVGLMTLATGSRGAETRQIFKDPGHIPGCEGAPSPCGVAVALATLDAAYSEQETAYSQRFDAGIPGFSKTFVAGTDTFARGWMQTFSDLARRYGIYILGSNDQTEFRESVDPDEIAKFADPDVDNPTSAYVATGPEVYNEAFMWGPRNVTPDGPRPLRNVVASNKKVPLTDIENLISLTPGPSTGPDAIENVRPYRIPGTKAKMSFATSLPAFVYNGGAVTPFGEAPGPGIDPCSDTSKYYMYCLDALGTNLVMQDEANPGLWATPSEWQPLEWMSSTWRAAADPTVDFDYNVTPHMVGNLADLVFDGQTAITQRGLKGPRGVKPAEAKCNYVGNDRFVPAEDPEQYRVYAGPKREFLGLAPWAAPDGPRDELRQIGAALAPGSGDPREDDYLETAVVADLTFPPVLHRQNCG